MRNGNFLKKRVSEIRVKRIRVNQGLGVLGMYNFDSTKDKFVPLVILLIHCTYDENYS